MAKKVATRAKRVARRDWSAQDERELRKHSKGRTAVKDISKALKRTAGALRQKAHVSESRLAIGALEINELEPYSHSSGPDEGPVLILRCFSGQSIYSP